MASKKTTKDYGDRQFNKMVKALKLSEEEVIDLIGGVRRNKKTGQIEHHKKGGPVVKAKFGTSGLLVKAVGKRSGQNLKGSSTSARRKWSEDPNVGVDGKVRASTDTADGPMKEVISGKNKSLQASPTAQRKRKAEGKQAADLKQPAAGSVGKGAEQADAGIAKFKIDAKKAKEYDKRIKELKKQVLKDRDIIRKLRKQKPTGVDRIKNSETIRKAKIKLEQNSLQLFDMKSRGGPGGKSKATEAQRKKIINKIKSLKKGGPVVKAKFGSGIGLLAGSLKKLSNEFDKLSPASKRAERLKGSKSKFYNVLKARNPFKIQRIRGADGKIKKADTRGYTDSSKKTGGPVVKAKFSSSGLLAGMAGMGSGAKAIAKKPKRKIIKKKKVNKGNSLKKKAGGGKITYRMTGGQVVDAGYD